MQVFLNEAFINRKARQGRIASIAGLALLAVGFVLSIVDRVVDVPNVGPVHSVLLAYVLLFPGLFIFNFGRGDAIRWGIRPREDEIITTSLKGLDARHHLYHYMPGIDVPHFVVGPGGIVTIEVRHQQGEVRVVGDRWYRAPSLGAWFRGMAEGTLGDPGRDAARHAAELRRYLSARVAPELAESVPITGCALFVSPRVQLVIEDPVIAVLVPRTLKEFVRRTAGSGAKTRLSDADLRTLWAAFEGEA